MPISKLDPAPESIHEKDVCIAGGGPAGMILGLLLAKAGLNVLVLEQHRDFEREYRGEVLMPRFLQMMRALGLEKDLLSLPHLMFENAELFYGNRRVGSFSFQDIAPEKPLALWMPQPVLLNAIHAKAQAFKNFEIWFDARAKSLLKEGERTTGVEVDCGKEKRQVKAALTVGADGRFSAVRKAGHFESAYRDYHFDIVWFTIPQPEGYDNKLRFYLSPSKNLLTLPKYPKHIQCGLIVNNGEFAGFRKAGIESIRKVLLACPLLVHDFAKGLKDFSAFNVLQAELEMTREWAKDGLLLIGDAAHTCSPAGAVGVSVAVETAIVAANVILKCFERKDFSAQALSEVQTKREKDIREIHALQKRFSRTLLTWNPLTRILAPLLFPLLARSPAFRKAQRKLALLAHPLEVDPRLRFES